MSFRFHKSVNLGLVKVNFSKSGIGYSFGVKGLRTGVDLKGRSYTSASLPGSGISYRTYKQEKDDYKIIEPKSNWVVSVFAITLIGMIFYTFNQEQISIKHLKFISVLLSMFFCYSFYFGVKTIISNYKIKKQYLKDGTINEELVQSESKRAA